MENTVDRKSRDALVTAINRYLDGESTAFQFDDEIFGITSDDPTVSHVKGVLWCFYDDCKDHKVRLSKDAWDYFQRLSLVLQSDGQIEVSTRRQWDYTNTVAIAALAFFLCVASRLGLGIHLLALGIPFGVVSIIISYSRNQTAAERSNRRDASLPPFSSLSELMTLRRRASSFRSASTQLG